jgi:hypothetical protein
MGYLLGLDIGTSGVKALLISVEGKTISSKTVSYPLKTSNSGWAEQSPYDWWEATVKAIKETVSNNPIDSNQIKGISLFGQMHSSVFLDEKMEVIRPSILWSDTHTSEQCKEIYAIAGGNEDTFYIRCLKGIGRIYHPVACDCFSSFGAAKVYTDKSSDSSTDFLKTQLVKKFAPVKIERILTDCGTEFTTWHKEVVPFHQFEKACKKLGIKHTTTKVRHPWTNGYVERLNKTLLDEFYSVVFRQKRYTNIEELQVDLNKFTNYYNYRRTHQGYKLKKQGCRTPAESHFSKDLTQDKKFLKIKSGKKEVLVGKNVNIP